MDLASALGSHSLPPDSTIKVDFPLTSASNVSSILCSSSFVLVDSPGIDVDTDADAWIGRAGAATDLFVWVVSGEATVTSTEREFFKRLAQTVARPNVLVLINRYVNFLNCSAQT